MTVASLTNKSGPYNGNGSVSNFAVNTKYTAKSEVAVIVTSAAGVETVKTLDTHYTLTDPGDSGTVTFITSPTDHRPQTGETVTIITTLALTQATDLTSGGSFSANVLEGAFDKLTRLVHQIAEKVTRAPKLRQTTTTGEVLLPEPAADKLLAWNSAGTNLTNVLATDIDITAVTPYIETLIDDETAAEARATLGVVIGTDVQAWDADLDAIAALATTAYGRSLLTLADDDALAAQVDAFFLTPAEGNAAYQPLDSDLTAIAALATATYGRSLLTLADAGALADELDMAVVLFDGAGDDTTDDGPALQTALDAADGRTVRLIPGLTYRIATAVVTRGKAWTLDARGANIHVDADIEALTAYADIDNLQSVSAISGADVTVANGAAFAVGDHVRVISEDVPTNARDVASGDEYKSGEPAIVASIAGNVLTMQSSLIHGAEMVTTPRIFRIPLEEQVRIIGGEWYYTEGHDATPWNSNMISLIGLISPRVEGVRITRGYSAGLALLGTQHAYVSGLRIERLTDNTSNSQFGYGLMDGGYNTTCVGISGEGCRHLVTTNPVTVPAATTDEDELHKYGHSRGLRVIGGTCMGASSVAFDTHHQTEDVVFSGLYAQNCTYAVQIRGQKVRVTDVEGQNISVAMVRVASDNTDTPATEAGWAADVYIDKILGNAAQLLEVARAKNVHVGRAKVTLTAWRAISVIDGEVFFHEDIDATIADTASTHAGRGVFDADDAIASFTPVIQQKGGRIRFNGSGSSGSTTFAAVNSDASAVTLRDVEIIFPNGSVGPMLVTANAGTIEADLKFDISGSAETGMTLTSGSNITANIESSDGTRDQLNLRRKAREPLKWISVGAQVTATIASGAITATGSFMSVDTEAAAATDTLDTINGGVNGDILILRTNNSARDVTVTETGGNLILGDTTRILDNVGDRLVLMNSNGNSWVELCFSDNGA